MSTKKREKRRSQQGRSGILPENKTPIRLRRIPQLIRGYLFYAKQTQLKKQSAPPAKEEDSEGEKGLLKACHSSAHPWLKKAKPGVVGAAFGVFVAAFGVVWDNVGIVWAAFGITKTPKIPISSPINATFSAFP